MQYHHGESLFFTNFDAEAHYGLTNEAEVMGKIYISGAQVGGRYTFLNTPTLKAAVGGYAGYYNGGVTSSSGTAGNQSSDKLLINGLYFDFPLTVSAHASEWFAVYGGPVVTRFDANAKHTVTDSGGTVTSSNTTDAHYFAPGGFLGLCIGRTVQLSPGVTFYLENDTYPIPAAGGNRIFAYPFIGLTFATGQNPASNPNP